MPGPRLISTRTPAANAVTPIATHHLARSSKRSRQAASLDGTTSDETGGTIFYEFSGFGTQCVLIKIWRMIAVRRDGFLAYSRRAAA
jgi:hypothetical protein